MQRHIKKCVNPLLSVSHLKNSLRPYIIIEGYLYYRRECSTGIVERGAWSRRDKARGAAECFIDVETTLRVRQLPYCTSEGVLTGL